MALPPPKCGEMGHCTGFLGRWNYPQWRGTRPTDALVYEYFEIDEVEQFLIEDTNRIVIPSAHPSRASDRIPTLRNSTDTSRIEYITVLCETLNDWASGGAYS